MGVIADNQAKLCATRWSSEKSKTQVTNKPSEVHQRANQMGKTAIRSREAGEASCASPAQLSDAMELAKIVYWEVDPATMDLIFNDAFYAFYGTTAEREGGYRMSREEYGKRFVHPDDIPVIRQAAEDRLASREPDSVYDIEHRVIRRDGEARHILTRIRVTRDAVGRVTGFYGANQDITERRRMAEAVQESEERLRLTLEATNDGIWDWNIPTGKAVFSPRYYTILGYKPYEFPENYDSWRSLVHPDDIGRVEDEIDEHIGRDKGFAIELRMRAKSGDWVWTLTRGKVVEHDSDGRPVRMVGTHTDITDRRSAEEALRESETRFRAAFDTAAIGMTLTALDGRWFKVNQSFCTMVGYSEEELLTKTFHDITHPDDLENDLEHRKRLIEDRISYYHIEKRYVHRDKYTVSALLCTSIVRDPHGYPLYFVSQIEDITERKLLEEKLQTMSITDELTGLYNRRGFFELASERLRLASKRHILFFADLDHMKWINDTLGHREGDTALATVAGLLKEAFRESDIIGRLGGDEFAILATGATEAEEEVLLARLKHNVERFNVDHTPSFPLSLSIGLSRCEPGDPRHLEALLAEADESMYEKKGRRQGGVNTSHTHLGRAR